MEGGGVADAIDHHIRRLQDDGAAPGRLAERGGGAGTGCLA
jgi:hypothetical protein